MKRSIVLQPLSREHHAALKLAKACEQAAQSGDGAKVAKLCQRAMMSCLIELEPHFQVEESALLPQLTGVETSPLVQRTLADHQNLRELAKLLSRNDAEALLEFGKSLSAHVRFEERELFPALEKILR